MKQQEESNVNAWLRGMIRKKQKEISSSFSDKKPRLSQKKLKVARVLQISVVKGKSTLFNGVGAAVEKVLHFFFVRLCFNF